MQLLLHGLGCAPIMVDGAVAGVVFESKEGRLAIRARVPLDVLTDTIQPFPTFSEIYVAALKALRGAIR